MAIRRHWERADAKAENSGVEIKEGGWIEITKDKVCGTVECKKIKAWGFHCFDKRDQHSNNECW